MPKERYLKDQQNCWIVRCCDDLIRSSYRHDFRSCRCGKSFCDGGTDYVRLGGANVEDDFEPVDSVRLSVELDTTHEHGRGETVADVVGKAWAKDGLYLGRCLLKQFEGDSAEVDAWNFVADW